MNIYWFRNDLRLDHNRVLQKVYEKEEQVIGLFILDNNLLYGKYSSALRNKFLFESLNDLNNKLESIYSSKLFVVDDNYEDFFTKISKEFSKKSDTENLNIYTSTDYSSYAIKRDKKVRDIIISDGNNNSFKSIKNLVLYDLKEPITNKANEPLKVFTPYKFKVLERLKNNNELLEFSYQSSSKSSKKELFYKNTDEKFVSFSTLLEKNDIKLANIKELLTNLELEIGQNSTTQKGEIEDSKTDIKGGSREAQRLWKDFKETKIGGYKENRNFLAMEGTSKLSAHLKFGTISPYQIVKECLYTLEQNKGVEHFLSEIIWREFYKHILMSFPHVENENFSSKYDKVKWLNDEEKFVAWCEGKTGFPIVDACMRQLNTTGWLHNRGRMIVASFLTKDLHIHWKKGEKYFQSKLIDYDLSSNNGGWQWTAGTGTDASPYFRIFNPIEQSKRFDPKGEFIKKFIPELGNVNDKYIHEPQNMPLLEQELSGCIIGKDYPTPIINHSEERKKALELYSFIKPVYEEV